MRWRAAPRSVLWSDTRFHRAHGFYGKHGYKHDGATRELHDLADTIESRFLKRT